MGKTRNERTAARPVSRKAGMATVAMLASCVYVSAQDLKPDDLRESAEAAQRQRLREQEDKDRARRLTEDFLKYIKETGELVDKLETKAKEFVPRLESLLTNDDGKRLAQSDAAVLEFVRIQDEAPIKLDHVKRRQQNLKAMQEDLAKQLKGPDVGYIPSQQLKRDVDQIYFWAQDRTPKVSEYDTWLTTVIAQAPKDVDLKKLSTLGGVISGLRASRIKLLAELRKKGADEAQPAADQMVVDAAQLAELERGLAEAQRLYRENMEELRRMKIEYEQQLKNKEAEVSTRLAELKDQQLKTETEAKQRVAQAEIRTKDAEAKLEQEIKRAEAERHARKVQSETESAEIKAKAEHDKKLALVQTVEVKTALAPFLAPGYYQPGSREKSYERKPISLKALKAAGALEPSDKARRNLARIACDKDDKERPRWSFEPTQDRHWKRLTDQQVDQITTAQKYLIDLGEVLVEAGMLAP